MKSTLLKSEFQA